MVECQLLFDVMYELIIHLVFHNKNNQGNICKQSEWVAWPTLPVNGLA